MIVTLADRIAAGRAVSGRPFRAGLAPALLALALLAAAAPAAELPTLVVEAPPELAAVARQLASLDREALLRPAMLLTGLADPGPPVVLVLAGEGSPAARAVPPWVSGFADGAAGVAVLLPERVPRYPDRNLAELVAHEVAHVLIARAAGHYPLPRWFDEGLAMAASGGADLEDRTRFTLAVLADGEIPLTRIDEAFAGRTGDVRTAYALSRDFVQELLRRNGPRVAADILAGVAHGAPFAAAFANAAAASLAQVESAYWRRRTLWNRWLPVLTSSAVLWLGVTLLALLAIQRRRARDARLHRLWEEEEHASAVRSSTGAGAPTRSRRLPPGEDR